MRRPRFMLCILAIIGSVALLSSSAAAVDGVIEINEARATAGGVTPSDAPGYPVTIDASGSYRLTGNLTVGGDLSAIQIVVAQNVTIDLNGFTIHGPTACTGIPVTTCQPDGSAHGIDGSARQAITITNGIIRGFGGSGLLVGPRARIEDVVVGSNASNGIQVGSESVIRTCRASQNGSNGLDGAVAVVIESSTADSNGQSGIRTGLNAVIENCTAVSNGTDGITVFGGSNVRSSAVRSNVNAGITTSGACMVAGNTASSNSSFGLLLGTGSGYLQNLMFDNNGAEANLQVNGGTDLGGNICPGGANGAACP